jgi:amino-acid N-acetyltransferase
MENIAVVFADKKDSESVKDLLRKASLPYQDISINLDNFLLAKENSTLVGIIGLELFGEYGLLRSLAVEAPYRKKGIAHILYERILAYAHLRGIKTLYLLTTTAEEFFSKLGFTRVKRNNVPTPIQNSEEFRSLCPSTAICMVKNINLEAQYYPREILHLQQDVPGAAMWAVALEKAMLTYFEVQPNCRFERHNHQSEQITMVLEGELFFQMDDRLVMVKKGEVIAVPSDIPHAVFTRKKSVKAIDAWSPVMEKYQR